MPNSLTSTDLAVLLVADANADHWLALIDQADHAVRVHCVASVRAIPERVAGVSIGVLCLDGVVASQNSFSFIEETIARARLSANAPIVLITRDPEIAERYRAQRGIDRVMLCRSQAEQAVFVAEFRALLMQIRMQAQLQLFTAALDGASHGVVVVNAHEAHCPIVYANPEFTRFSGFSANEALGRDLSLLVGPESSEDSMAALHGALRNGAEFVEDVIHYKKDGAAFWNHVELRAVSGGAAKSGYRVLSLQDVTEDRRLRERLRASEARLELAMSASELAMWDWNVATGDIYYNDQWQSLLEFPAEELLLRESLHGRLAFPEEDPSLLVELEKHLSGETPRFEREFELRTASGRQKSISARANVVRRDDEGNALRVIGVWRDVTARKASVRAIEETHKRWERAVAGTSDGLFDWDLQSGYVWYAPRFRELLGYSDTEFNATFQALQRVLHDEERLTVLTKVRSHLEQRTPLDLRCRVLCKSGEYRWFRLRGNAERDPAGRPKRLSGSLRDIHGQIDAEEALHRNEDFYRTVLDLLPLTVAYVDREERVIYVNRAGGELLAKDITQIRGQLLRDVLSPDLYVEAATNLVAAFRGETLERQFQLQDAGGQPLDVDLTYAPHADQSGRVQGCFFIARNITARVRLEAELRQSQKMEAIGKLTGGVAHDFNNLLSVTIGNAQLLTRTLKDSPRLHKQAETILRAAMRGAELTRRLLTFARQQNSATQVSGVNELVAGMYDLLRRTLPGDIALRLDLDQSTGSVKLEPGQFENALLNLVVNARDAMPRGGAISIGTSNVTLEAGASCPANLPPGDYVRITVADNGQGIKPEMVARVFEPFFTTKEFGKGTGLGLAMVQSFVRECAGGAAIDSEVGKGTQVHLYLARAQADLAAHDEPTVVAAELPRGEETILVVDDDDDVRTTTVEMLSSLGYRVLQAAGGRDALAIGESEASIHLLFADVMLSGSVSCSVLVRRMREGHPGLKLLLSSSFSDTFVTHRSLIDGTVELLHKPYELADLARRVRGVLDSPEEKLRVQA